MVRIFTMIAMASIVLVAATGAFAQQGPNANPMGLDYGPFHPAVPPQVTTYYPPSEPAVAAPRRHYRRRQATR